jgi:hypothetical protein
MTSDYWFCQYCPQIISWCGKWWCFYFACFSIFWIKCILLKILNKMNIIAYFDYKNTKNECLIVNFTNYIIWRWTELQPIQSHTTIQSSNIHFRKFKKYVLVACNTRSECESYILFLNYFILFFNYIILRQTSNDLRSSVSSDLLNEIMIIKANKMDMEI